LFDEVVGHQCLYDERCEEAGVVTSLGNKELLCLVENWENWKFAGNWFGPKTLPQVNSSVF
jgi:hypothetical protein